MTLFRGVATWALVAASVGFALATPTSSHKDKRYIEVQDDITYNVFEHAATGTKMSFVNNSGICETTPGVNQYSGYLTVGQNMNMWFWFFEARNNPTTAPLAAWFNGGPGCSSMIGLFQENGPCHFVNNETEPSVNPYSFNEYANMLYVDQPIGVGFSYGNDTVVSTVTAAPFVWNLIQAFFAQFPEYETRDFGIFTESYGGHYGPEFSHYIQGQNAGIANGTIEGDEINLIALGINNGWYNLTIQEKAAIDFASNNSYRPLISEAVAEKLYTAYDNVCLPAIQNCTAAGTNAACIQADNICEDRIDGVIYDSTDFDPYDIRSGSRDPNPPETYTTYLARAQVRTAIGAKTAFKECPSRPAIGFSLTGDDARSFLETISEVVQTGVQFLSWAGDADYICNWVGNYGVANAIDYDGHEEFAAADLAPYTVNGTEMGQFKTVDNLSFLRVYEAGHEVPFYQPELALQAFTQTMQRKAISST
ncbi:putative carboxypeptidase S1 [Xylariales sp. AK1849]|nr:putative carboxypeptidase S1 [Xylariales sp. AK1849]